jgi:hypothetical protein
VDLHLDVAEVPTEEGICNAVINPQIILKHVVTDYEKKSEAIPIN